MKNEHVVKCSYIPRACGSAKGEASTKSSEHEQKYYVFIVNQSWSCYIKLGSFLPQTYLFLRLDLVKSLDTQKN